MIISKTQQRLDRMAKSRLGPGARVEQEGKKFTVWHRDNTICSMEGDKDVAQRLRKWLRDTRFKEVT